MESGYWILWAKAAIIRAIKTFAQTAVAMIAVGACFSDIDWLMMVSVSGVAALASLLTSLAGLPEVETEEELADINVQKGEAAELAALMEKVAEAKHKKD